MRLGFLIFALMWGGGAHAAPIVGFWLGPVDPDGNQSTIEIYPCADQFCGRVSAVTLASSAYLVDQVILLNLKRQSDAVYTGGLIRFDHLSWQFGGSISMAGRDAATLRGCWARVICQNVAFTRISG